MDLDFETFLNELNTAGDNTIYNQNFEDFLDTIYRMDNERMQQQFNMVYEFDGGDDLLDDEDDLEEDNLLEVIEDYEQEADAPFDAD